MYQEFTTLINGMCNQIPKKNIAEVYKHNKQRQLNLVQRKSWAPSIKYSMFQSNYGTNDYQIVPQESSDSESIVFTPSQYPSLHKVASQIIMISQYSQIPCSTVLKDGLKSKLIIKNIDENIDIQKLQEFVDKLPIKGFVQEIKLIYYQSNPCLLFQLKTDQPLIVANQFMSKQNQKQAKSIFGYKFTCAQLALMNEEFAAVILRGLDKTISTSQIEKIISYTLKLEQKECIRETQKHIIEIENVGCITIVLKDLEYCEKVVIAFNGTNLNGLQKNKILVNVHPESVKVRRIDLSQSIQKGLLQVNQLSNIQKIIKVNEEEMN
ncbi:unnamed protein product (macronuclear) [Paramecium tetraurelia]|uniref:RRM domain-containing protein n=1 Tax=Paramecium tetraurelia TaxID=5888 RepID=A0E0D5_PARTE|nr:uncharacterized protein GSPATT00021920001 [Paramecium tetraurelia]CAK88752.1 unnamed protein product [Paramecium tetraurelia]|eukprot:XP_001456149.1 hypothetical protein (macronuclear) [Paramecium tetraurelia strain d4-2]